MLMYGMFSGCTSQRGPLADGEPGSGSPGGWQQGGWRVVLGQVSSITSPHRRAMEINCGAWGPEDMVWRLAAVHAWRGATKKVGGGCRSCLLTQPQAGCQL